MLLAVTACVPEGGDSGELSLTCSFETGLSLQWREGDAISVFSGTCTGGEKYVLNSEDAGSQSATFKGATVGKDPYYALYPYDGSASYGNGVISCELPAVQRHGSGAYGKGVFPMSAYSRNSKLHFSMLGRGLCLQLTGTATIKSVQLVTGGTPLWGHSTVNLNEPSNPVLTVTSAADDAHCTLTLDCGEGQALGSNVQQFYFFIPPESLNKGFDIRVFDSIGGEMLLGRDKGVSIQRGQTCMLDAVEYCRTSSPFLSESEFGIYDLGAGNAVPMRAYRRGDDQLALRKSPDGSCSFRIQTLKDANALTVSVPSSEWTRGARYRLTVSSIGNTSVPDFTCDAVLERADAGRLWFEDEAGARGIIIASEL